MADEHPPGGWFPSGLFRVRLYHRTGATSWSTHEYFERYDRMAERVLQALIEAHANNRDNKLYRLVWLGCRAWFRQLLRRGEEDPEAKVAEVHVDLRVGDGWQPVPVKLLPPRLEWTEISQNTGTAIGITENA